MTDPRDKSFGPTGKTGNLTKDPELRYSSSGTAIANFGLAVKPYTPKGEPEAETTFYDCVAFGSLAEHVAECLAKGDRVVVVGEGKLEHWKTKAGEERTSRKIVADAVGPDLRFATADVSRTDRRGPAASSSADEEPF